MGSDSGLRILFMGDSEMGRRGKFWIKGVIFSLILGSAVMLVNRVLTPKFFYNNTWPTTSAYLGFYEMERDTVDVLFFGSSHGASSFSPQVLYNRHGITSYNLSCEQQNLLISYYWLREALRYQSPKAVILDCYMLFPYNAEEPLNTAESCTRKAMDYMRWSSVKREAVHAICKADGKQTKTSYYLPNIRFHTRWMGLNEEDFTVSEMAEHYELKGFTAIPTYSGIKDYRPFSREEGKGEEGEPMVSLMEEYLEKITELCKEKGISLILVKTPSTAQNIKRHQTIQNYAKEHGLSFFDFNEKELYKTIGYEFAKDNCDSGHGSVWGAAKITCYLGQVLQNQCGIEERAERQWEESREYYTGIIKDCTLAKVTDMNTYLELLKDERYWVFMAVRDEASRYLDETTAEKMRNLGLEAKLEGQQRCSYYAVIAEGQVKEEAGYEKLKDTGRMRKERSVYDIVSAGYECGNESSIRIDGIEYGKNQRGLNIVVYNHVTKTVIDSVCFDSYEEGREAKR